MYQIHELKKIPGLFHAFSTKEEGNMASVIFGEVLGGEEVLKNRINFFQKYWYPSRECGCHTG